MRTLTIDRTAACFSLVIGLICIPILGACQDQKTPPIAPNIQKAPLPDRIEVTNGGPARPITADEAVRIALKTQPTLDTARSAIAAASGRTEQVRSGLNPVLAGSVAYTHANVLAGNSSVGTSVSTSPGYQASTTLRQLLFDFEHTRNLVRQASLLEKVASTGLTRAENDLALQVKQAFYTYVQSERLVGVNEANVQNQQEHVALADARLKSGLGLPSDVVRAQTAVAEAVLNLNLAQSTASTVRINLATFMGIDPRTPLTATDSEEPSEVSSDISALVARGLKQRPEILQAQAGLDSTTYGIKAAKSTDSPSIGASIGLSSRGLDFPPRNDLFAVGATVTWTPFDGGLTRGKMRESQANSDAARSQLATAKLIVTQDISQSYLSVKTSEQRLVTADAEIANATESVRLAEGRYRSGLGTFIDVLDAQTSLFTAKSNRVNALSAISQARAALRRAIGSPARN